MRITACSISPLPQRLLDPMPEVSVTLEDGSSRKLFSFFPDEISFVPADFIGLTVEQAHELRQARDTAYLRS